MADPSEQNPVVKDEIPKQRPGLDPQMRKVAIFLSIAVLILALSMYAMAVTRSTVGGTFALLGGALAFAALLHVTRRTNGD